MYLHFIVDLFIDHYSYSTTRVAPTSISASVHATVDHINHIKYTY